jgi:hypothetical protein
MAAKPFEEADEAARKASEPKASGSKVGGDAVKQTLAAAAAGALAAGIAGAAKALHDRQDRDGAPEEDVETEPDSAEDGPETTEPVADAEPEPEAESPDRDADQSEEEEPPAEEPRGEAEADGGGGAAEQPKPRPTTGRDAQAVVQEARRQLQDVLGVEPEAVSGFERSENGWVVTVEVVEVRRVPDSTDVLSSYEVTLDDDRNLVGISQKRRYRRSQVEEG